MRRRAARLFAGVVAVGLCFGALSGCTREEAAPPLSALKPKPLPVPVTEPGGGQGETLDLDAGELEARARLFEVEAAPVFGEELPEDGVRLELRGDSFVLGGKPLSPATDEGKAKLEALAVAKTPVLIVPDEETYLAQTSPLFAALDDAGVKVWLVHPEGKVGYPITLSDEVDFRTWLDEVAAGKIRIIHRADGYELQTNIGKLPGPDPNGPSVPRRGGKWDIARLRASLEILQNRFESDAESCIVPSFGMELAAVSQAISGYYTEPGDRLFPAVCLVYPRPAIRDAGTP